MITQTKSGQFGVNEYVCDYASDIINLPTSPSAGSSAMCIENGKVFMFNGESKWVEI